VPDEGRYAFAAVLAAVGVHQGDTSAPVKEIEISIRGLPEQFDGFTILQLADLHISRLFPTKWARAVVERSNNLGVNLIVVTGDLIDGTLAARRADV
jgi:predicted MPP superfamily phosphohydrolase